MLSVEGQSGWRVGAGSCGRAGSRKQADGARDQVVDLAFHLVPLFSSPP